MIANVRRVVVVGTRINKWKDDSEERGKEILGVVVGNG